MSAAHDMTVANTILAQLGGHRFIAMTGAKHLLGDATSLQFAIGTGAKSGINKVRVTLEASDTYTVRFYKMKRRGLDWTEVACESDVYADCLQRVFTSATGFDTHL